MKPLLTNNFLDYFLKLNLKDKTFLEIGAGDSTIFFSKIFKKMASFEDDETIFNNLKKLNMSNVRMFLFNDTNIENLLVPCLYESSLIILIDNNPNKTTRIKVAKLVHKHIKKDAIIILDNGEKNLDAYWFLKSRYYCLDFPGKRYDNTYSLTTMFFNESN